MRIYDKIVSAFGILRDIISRKAEKTDLAPEFSTSSTYGEGTLVMKDGTLYRCTSIHSGSWSSDDFERTTVDAVLARMSMAKSSSGAAEATDAAGQEAIDAEYAVLSVGAEETKDPYEDAVEMKPSNVSTAFLKGDVKLCGVSVVDIKNVDDASYMLAWNTGITACTVPDLFKPGNMDYMFMGCTSLEQVDFSNNEITIDGTRDASWSAEGMFSGCMSLSSVCKDEKGYNSINFISRFGSIREFFKGCSSIDKVKFRATHYTDSGEYAKSSEIKSASGLFNGCVNLTEAHIEGFSVGYVAGDYIGDSAYSSLADMFAGCTRLTTVSLTTIAGYENEAFLPFAGIKSLETVSLYEVFSVASYFDPEWFDGTPLKAISISYSFAYTYFESTLLPKTLTSVSIVYSFLSPSGGSSKAFDSFMANGNLTSLKLVHGFFDNCKNLDGSFLDCERLSEAEINSTENASASYMFKGCIALQSCKVNGNIGCQSNVVETFYGCPELTSLELPDNFGEGATDASRCFYCCTLLTTIDAKKIGTSPKCYGLLSCFSMTNDDGVYVYGLVKKIIVSDSFGTQAGVDVSSCFEGCIYLNDCALPEGFGKSASSVHSCFRGCWKYKPSLPKSFGMSARYVYSCFEECSAIEELDLSGGFGAHSTVESVSSCFHGCTKLSSLKLRADFGSNATSVYACFSGCKSLISLPAFSGFGSSAVEFGECFKSCEKLTSLSLPADFGSKAESAENVRYCFDGCTSLNTITAIKFPVSFSLACCPLTGDSARVVFNGLVDVSGETTNTLEMSYTTFESLSPSDIAIANKKGWSVVEGTCDVE